MIHKKPFIIAEISGNHKQSLKRALKLIDVAADVGVDAIKLQTFTPQGMTLNIKKGEIFTEQNLTAKRPGDGLSPFKIKKFLGKKSQKNYKKDQQIKQL